MRVLSIVLAASCVLVACQPTPEATEPARTGPYLGETVPGSDPVMFGRGLVSTHLDVRDTAWAPAGDELYWTLWARNRATILTMRLADGGWVGPEIAPFSGVHPDLEPFITADGGELYFASQRPLEAGGEPRDWDLWRVPRTSAGWGEPENLGAPVNTAGGEYYPSLTAGGTLYFTATRDDTLGGEDIYRSRPTADGWSEPENLGPTVNSPGPEFNSLVAPDESWLIFGSVREGDLGGGDLYISFRDDDEEWTPAVAMGEPFNSPVLDFCPALSPDGRFFFFTSRRTPDTSPAASYAELVEELSGPDNGSMNLYWVEASLIDGLRSP